MKKIIVITFCITLIQGCSKDEKAAEISDVLNLVGGINELTINQTIRNPSINRHIQSIRHWYFKWFGHGKPLRKSYKSFQCYCSAL